MSGRASTQVQSSLIFCCPIPDTLSSPEDAKMVVCEECYRTSCLGLRGLQSPGYGEDTEERAGRTNEGVNLGMIFRS